MGQRSDRNFAASPARNIAAIQALLRAQDYNQALQRTRAALKNAPGDARLWTFEGIAFSMKGKSHEALLAFDKALSLSPDNPAALRGEVQLLYLAKDKRAIPLLERILKSDANDATAQEMLANIEKQRGHCQAAVDHFLASAETVKQHPESLEAYGYCLVQTTQPEKAIAVFEQLVTLLPQETYPKYDLAVVLAGMKQYQAALRLLDPLLTANQSDSDLLSLASDAYEATGDTPRAMALLRQAIVLSPADASLYNAFALICLNHDSFQVGIDMVDAGLQRVPNDPSLFISRGLLYAQRADYDKAEADFASAEHLDSQQSISVYALDLAEMQKTASGKHAAGSPLAEVRSQLKAHPDSALLHCLLTRLLLEQGSDATSPVFAEAMTSAQRALALKPDLVEARDLLAGMYLKTGEFALAITQCRVALQYDPTDESALYHLIIGLRRSAQGAGSGELEPLVKRLSALQQSSLQQETGRKRFRLVEEQSPPGK